MADKKIKYDFAETAKMYLAKGLVPLPLKKNSKGAAPPAWNNFATKPPDEELLDRWHVEYRNPYIGLAMGSVIDSEYTLMAIDIDSQDFLDDALEAVGGYASAKRGQKGLTSFHRVKGVIHNTKLVKDGRPAIEILSRGTQTVVPPSIHPKTGEPYKWLGVPLNELDLWDLPIFTSWMLDELTTIVQENGGHFRDLNSMEWAGVDGGGNTHDTCVKVVAYLVSRDWPDEAIHERIARGKRRAVEKAGEQYDWPDEEKSIQEWIDSARRKGMAGSSKKKVSTEYKASAEWIAMMGGPDMVRGVQGEVRVYRDGVWSLMPRTNLQQSILANRLVTAIDDVKKTAEMVYIRSHDSEWFEEIDPDPAVDPMRNRLCFTNGTYNVITGEMEPHSPDHKLLWKLDFDFDPHYPAKEYEKFIYWVFDGDKKHVNTWEEYAGLSLVPDISYQKMLILKGQGANGKSTLVGNLRSLHDKSALSSVNITNLGDERSRTMLVNKLLNVSSEENRLNVVADDFLKKITGGDAVPLRRLYGETFEDTLRVRFINALNDLPTMTDSSHAMERRMMILATPNRVEGGDIDKSLPAKLHAERAGIVVRLLNALRMLRERTWFDEPAESRNAVISYLTEQDSVRFWMQEMDVVGSRDHGVPSTDLYNAYSDFCDRANVKPQSLANWGNKLTNMGYPSIVKKVHGKNVRVRELKMTATGARM